MKINLKEKWKLEAIASLEEKAKETPHKNLWYHQDYLWRSSCTEEEKAYFMGDMERFKNYYSYLEYGTSDLEGIKTFDDLMDLMKGLEIGWIVQEYLDKFEEVKGVRADPDRMECGSSLTSDFIRFMKNN